MAVDSFLEPPSSERSELIDCQDAPELWLNVPMALMVWQEMTWMDSYCEIGLCATY